MWRDSETELDFLDYNYLVKTIQSIITNEDLLPASIGVYGDWGSGKSSLMHMCKKKLESEDPKIKCIVFNGWLFENYEDAKTAILGSILDEIASQKRLPAKAKEALTGLYKSVDKFKVAKNALKIGTDFLLTGGIGTITTLTFDQLLKSLQDSSKNLNTEQAQQMLDAVHNELNNNSLREDIRSFQKEFSNLLKKTNISRLVVFIDELDRCRPDTILDTLEAIKLFLFTGNVAFIIGADERHVAYAVKSKFKDIEGIQIDIGKEYLEKLIQYPIRIPRLATDEAEIYITCLLLQTELSPEMFDQALSWITSHKEADFENFQISGILELFVDYGDIHSKVKECLAISRQLASVLSNGLHGNPRQFKRFLNSMDMRMQMAAYRHKNLDRKVLAKLMMLEYIKPRIFNLIADISNDSTLQTEVKSLEEGQSVDLVKLKLWKDDEWFNNWCKIEPHLSDIENIKLYFYFTRTSLSEQISRVSSILSPEGQEILTDLLSKAETKIKAAITKSTNLSSAEASAILEALNTTLSSETLISAPHIRAFLQFACSRKELVSDAVSYLQNLSGSQISAQSAAYIAQFGKDTNQLSIIQELADTWGANNDFLKKALLQLIKE